MTRVGRRWLGDLAIGARFTVAGGRAGALRTLFIVLGIALGTTLFLLAGSVPTMVDARDDRGAARLDRPLPPDAPAGPTTVLITSADTDYRGDDIRGRLVRAEGERPVLPPGLRALPGDGEMAVSPALADLLRSSDGKLLRERLPYRITENIADSGLVGPAELAFYAGSATLTSDSAARVDGFGRDKVPTPLGSLLTLLAVAVFVALLTPVMVFVAIASRFGASGRDRRMAVLRLIGADRPMMRRLTIGESLVYGVAGTALGVLGFLAGREFVRSIVMWDVSVFPHDVRPPLGLAALVLLAVPAATVAAALLAHRGVVAEPLGVARRAPAGPRHLWARLLPATLGLVLLLPMLHDARTTDSIDVPQLAIGVGLLLVGITPILPWVVNVVTARLGAGPTPWLLGVRRLRAETTASVRVVNGMAVAVAGAIAVQTLLTGIESTFTAPTGYRADLADAHVRVAGADSDRRVQELAAAAGVEKVVTYTESTLSADRGSSPGDRSTLQTVVVADCTALRSLTRIDDCVPGDVFTGARNDDASAVSDLTADAPMPMHGAPGAMAATPMTLLRTPAGTAVRLSVPGTDNQTVAWTVPLSVKHLAPVDGKSTLIGRGALYVTPEALAGTGYRPLAMQAFVKLAPGVPDAVEHVRNAAARVDPGASVATLEEITQVREYTNIKRGLFIGAAVTLMLIAVSMLVSTMEQLREQRRPLAALAAIGTPHRTLALSVLAQAAVPLVVGLVLAVGCGVGLGVLLLGVAAHPLIVDWTYVGAFAGLGATMVAAVALLGLPPLWRLVRPENLRTE